MKNGEVSYEENHHKNSNNKFTNKSNEEEKDYKNNTNNSNDSKEKNKASTSFECEIEKNNFFTSDFCTVIVIEIYGLNEYVHILSPQQLTQYIKSIYDEIEKTSKEFPSVSILKMNIEQIVCCIGLFTFVNEIEEQAKQAVLYACSMTRKIDQINEELNINLQLKIGINSGGPIIGSMISPTTPSFEIFGDFISLAKRIQNECQIGVVNVSSHVADKLDKNIFGVEFETTLHVDSNDAEIQIFKVDIIEQKNNV